MACAQQTMAAALQTRARLPQTMAHAWRMKAGLSLMRAHAEQTRPDPQRMSHGLRRKSRRRAPDAGFTGVGFSVRLKELYILRFVPPFSLGRGRFWSTNMPLTPDELNQLLEAAHCDDGPDPAGKPEDGCRHEPRVTFDTPIVIHLASEEYAPRKAFLKDVSANGVGVLCTIPISIGAHCMIHLPQKDATDATVLAEVRHCTPTPDGRYYVGFKLVAKG